MPVGLVDTVIVCVYLGVIYQLSTDNTFPAELHMTCIANRNSQIIPARIT